ncbi:MAG TPA: pyridoxal phosphate-dependent aminotransferase [Candidatus Eisenbacteria bacterium]|nr:pyridoxal phosphate-dependent aminotransferase [Candidatus Eisenbacteria bacterium]
MLDEKRRAGRPVVDLAETNPTRVGLPSIAGALGGDVARYDPDPRGSAAAREAIAAYSRARGAGSFDPDRILLTASTSEAYAHLFRLLCDPGDEILVPSPSYPLFEPLARLESARLASYRLRYDEGWRVDVDSVEALVGPRTRALIVVQPNNPTGSCLTEGEAAALESICAERRIALIADEVFGDFGWREAVLPSVVGRGRALRFGLNGISKLCGLPQMKLGWIAVTGPEDAVARACQGLEWIADLFLSVGAPAQMMLGRWLERRGEFQEAARARIGANLDQLRLAGAAAGFDVLRGDGGWSAILRFRMGTAAGDASDAAAWALEERDVLLHPGHFYELEDCDAVVSLIVEPRHVREGIERIVGMRSG